MTTIPSFIIEEDGKQSKFTTVGLLGSYSVPLPATTNRLGSVRVKNGLVINDLGDLSVNFENINSLLLSQSAYGTCINIEEGQIDLSLGSIFTKVITTNTEFTVVNSEDHACVFTLFLTNGGSATITWPSGTKWAGGTPPELQNEGIDVISFISPDGGNAWYGIPTCINAK